MFSHLTHKLIYKSDAVKIGKTQWRVIVYEKQDRVYACGKLHPAAVRYTEYQYFDASLNYRGDQWADSTQHPRFNHNDGTYAGLPKSLCKIFYANQNAIQAALGEFSYNSIKRAIEKGQ